MTNITSLCEYRAQLAAEAADKDLRDKLRTVCDVTIRAIDKGLDTKVVLDVLILTRKSYFPVMP